MGLAVANNTIEAMEQDIERDDAGESKSFADINAVIECITHSNPARYFCFSCGLSW